LLPSSFTKSEPVADFAFASMPAEYLLKPMTESEARLATLQPSISALRLDQKSRTYVVIICCRSDRLAG
jgi:hypothetical protein